MGRLSCLISFELFAEFASFALAQFSAEAFLHKVVQAVTKRLKLNLVDDFVDKGVL